ncbi:class III cytochrome C family protein [Bradyrhizobium sp.]|uniref:class III cytochrome C family protein n=1 Tax=Bradyrhizobium sp. TaxID=376 RepID=UPI00391A5A38
MKPLNAFYLLLIVAGMLAGGTAIAMLYRAGSAAIPGWQETFQPGPLSEKHAFLNGKCEACHTPARGVEAQTCIKCHANAAAELAKQPTAFHAKILDCRGCHSEHETAGRPTRMDHASLVRIGSHHTSGAAGHPGVTRQMVKDMADFLGVSVSPGAERSALNCASCHSSQDPHQELFGRDCASCHATETWRVTSFLHPSPASKICAQCHQAPPSHFTEHFAAGSMGGHGSTQINQCYQCHKTNSFKDRKEAAGGGMH